MIQYVGDGSLKDAFLSFNGLNGRHNALTIKTGYLNTPNSMSMNESSPHRMVTQAHILCAFKKEYEDAA